MDFHAATQPLQTFYGSPLSATQTRYYQTLVVEARPHFYRSQFDASVGRDNGHAKESLALDDGELLDDDGILTLFDQATHTCELAGQDQAIGIGKVGLERQLSGRRVDGGIEIEDVSLVVVDRTVGQD